MCKFIIACMTLCCFMTTSKAEERTIEIRVIHTSDVHGNFFPYDFINRTPAEGSLARVSSMVKSLRNVYGERLLLLDGGDILQGQPTCYYCNYVKPELPNVAASVINFLKYDAQTIGNHDIETGHPVYDKWISEVKCPMLGANIVSTKTNSPYVKPYTIIERDGIRIAIIGLITPAIPNWLNERLWKDIRFDEMVSSARQWIGYVKANERPDIIIGLFHSGLNGGIKTVKYEENATEQVAREVPGFDLILYGHDHKAHKEYVTDSHGNKVLCLNPSSDANYVSDASIKIKINKNKVVSKVVTGNVSNICELPADQDFINHFQSSIDSVSEYVNRKIGNFENSLFTHDSYFGNSAFCDLIHNIQLKITKADISFNAPLTFDSSIEAGDVHVSDLFNLYKYENQICVLRMTGKEIRDYLELSYALWTNQMKDSTDHIMLLEKNGHGHKGYGFKNLAFNFDSAAGIDYEVDVTKPQGKKIRIISMSDGKPFSETKWYNVAMNSYRANGGGELLTKGAGIPHDSLKNRTVFESERDQRFYIMKEIESAGTMNPQPNKNWQFIPENWTQQAIKRDKELLFDM